MSQPRGRGGHGNRKQSNQGIGRGNEPHRAPNQNPQQNVQPSNEPNFAADPDAFGPPLGGRRQNRNQGGQNRNQAPGQSVWGAQAASAQASGSRPQAQSQPQPQSQSQPQPQQQAQAWQQGPSSRAPQSNVERAPKKNVGSGEPSKPTGAIKKTTDAPSTSKPKSDDRGKLERSAASGPLVKTKPDNIDSKQGTAGKQIVVKANYFALSSKALWQIFHYHVTFVPEIENPLFRNYLLVNQVKQFKGFVYDRGTSVYTTTQLQNDRLEISTRDRDGRDILIKIQRVGLISPLEHRYIQVLNVIMRSVFKGLDLKLVGRDYFDSVASVNIRQHGIELWPGYTTSIRQHESSLLMMAEIKHKLMRTETVLNILHRCHNESRTNYQPKFLQEVLGMVVLTRYNNTTYRINDVLFNESPESTFPTKNGPMTYIDYYRTKYGKTIVDKKQPLLRSTPTERDVRGARGRDEEAQPINLIPELCSPTGYTDEMRRNFNLMRDLAEHTRVGPAQRTQKLLDFNQRLQKTAASIKCFTDWALNLSPSLVTINNARELPTETILLGNQKTVRAERGDWTNALQGRNSMYRSTQLKNWVAIIPKALQADAMTFINTLIQVSRGMNFEMDPPQIVDVPDDRTTTLSTILDKKCHENKAFMFVAVSNNQAERYSGIKKVCSVRHAVPSQVVTRRVMDNRNPSRMRSVATKVAIQMNAKNSGMPWFIDIKMNNVMFVGYDVCHDTRDRSRSYGAIVATMDMRKSTRFFSAVSAHTNGEELSNNLSLDMVKALRQYQSEHGCLPDRIMFYRDGVGEGQTSYVFEHELSHLRVALQQFYGEKPLKLGFIIVSKRINTKFFMEDRQRITNVPPGTIVDDVVTLPERYDFFLVSQNVTQGTATPTNYNVLYDTFGMPPNHIQQLTYKMCHLYYNWSGTTRVPSVCQYAHKLAFLAGNFLHASPSMPLSPYLHFL